MRLCSGRSARIGLKSNFYFHLIIRTRLSNGARRWWSYFAGRDTVDDDVSAAILSLARQKPTNVLATIYIGFNWSIGLPDSLIKRLKDFHKFQGARYEILVAAVFTRAGFDIEWIDDTKASGKHPEFIATHKRTGRKIAVEAKSRRRPGIQEKLPGTVTP